jgi:hypothetical protein
MRTPASSRQSRITLVGSNAPAVTALWNLAAAHLDVRWYTDDADVGAEIGVAHGLGRGRIELRLDDPRAAPLDGAVVVAERHDGLDVQIAERARAAHVPVHVIGRPDLSTVALAELIGGSARAESFAAASLAG